MRDFFKVADGPGVVDELDESRVWAVGDNWVGFHPDLYVFFDEDLIEETYKLHGHVLLPEIVAWFDHVTFDAMTRYFTVYWFLGQLFLGFWPFSSEITLGKDVGLFLLHIWVWFCFVFGRFPVFYALGVLKRNSFSN